MGTRGLARKLAGAAFAIAALLAAAAPADSATSAIAVTGYSVSGGIVQVTLKNTSSASVSGTLAVQVVVNGSAIWGLVPVTLAGGQSSNVSAGFTGTVSDVTTVGVICDGPNPI